MVQCNKACDESESERGGGVGMMGGIRAAGAGGTMV